MVKLSEIRLDTIMTGTDFSKLNHLGSSDLQRLSVLEREIYRDDLPEEVREWLEKVVKDLKNKKRGIKDDN